MGGGSCLGEGGVGGLGMLGRRVVVCCVASRDQKRLIATSQLTGTNRTQPRLRTPQEECVALIMNELARRGRANPHTLAYQSRVGPVEWLKPYTDVSIRCGRHM